MASSVIAIARITCHGDCMRRCERSSTIDIASHISRREDIPDIIIGIGEIFRLVTTISGDPISVARTRETCEWIIAIAHTLTQWLDTTLRDTRDIAHCIISVACIEELGAIDGSRCGSRESIVMIRITFGIFHDSIPIADTTHRGVRCIADI